MPKFCGVFRIYELNLDIWKERKFDFKMTLVPLLLRSLTKAPIYLKIDAFIPMNFHLLTFQICSKLLHTILCWNPYIHKEKRCRKYVCQKKHEGVWSTRFLLRSKNMASRSQSEVGNGRKNKTLNCAETIDFDGKSFHFLGLIVRT